MTNPLDWTKPIQTRDGRKARVWDEPLSDGRRVVVFAGRDGGERVFARAADGRYCDDTPRQGDIINAPEPERWAVVDHQRQVLDLKFSQKRDAKAEARARANVSRYTHYIAKLIPVTPEKESDDG